MGKQDRLDGSETTFTDTDPEKAPVGRHEQTLKSAGNAMAGEEKERLVEAIRDWLRE